MTNIDETELNHEFHSIAMTEKKEKRFCRNRNEREGMEGESYKVFVFIRYLQQYYHINIYSKNAIHLAAAQQHKPPVKLDFPFGFLLPIVDDTVSRKLRLVYPTTTNITHGDIQSSVRHFLPACETSTAQFVKEIVTYMSETGIVRGIIVTLCTIILEGPPNSITSPEFRRSVWHDSSAWDR